MEENRWNEELEIDLGQLLLEVLRHWWLIGLTCMICAVAGFCVSKFVISPTFESTTAIYVVSKQDNSAVSYSDLQLGSQLTKDYLVLAKSRTVMERVIQTLDLDMTVEELQQKVVVSNASDTRIMYVTVTHTSPEMAQKIANTVREIAAEHIKEIMKIEEINVAEEANYPLKKAGPSISKWTMLGGIIGAFVTAGTIALLFILNDKVLNAEDVERYLKLSTLASVPYNEKMDKQTKK